MKAEGQDYLLSSQRASTGGTGTPASARAFRTLPGRDRGARSQSWNCCVGGRHTIALCSALNMLKSCGWGEVRGAHPHLPMARSPQTHPTLWKTRGGHKRSSPRVLLLWPGKLQQDPLTCTPLGQKGLRGLREAPPPSSAPANDLQTSPNSSGWTLRGQTAVTPAGLGGGSRGSEPLQTFHPLPAPGAESSLCAPHPWGTWQWLTAASQDRNIPGISLATCAQPLPK